MRPVFLIIFFLPLFSFAQKTLKGVITEAEKNKPLASASVFLNNTSVGTTTNAEGYFEIHLPAGRFELIVSSVGYETVNQMVSAATTEDFLRINLKPKVKELETVVIEPFEKDGWAKWGRFFLENFIGTSAHARDCRILNEKAIRFRHSKARAEITAHAFEPLIIENRSLGYTIRYQLEGFQYNFNTKLLFYQGYPFFQPMKGSEARQRRWAKKREEVYYGSMLHFMRTIYVNRLSEEGFEVRSLVKEPNLEKQRISAILRQMARTQVSGTGLLHTGQPDSTSYYNSVLRQPDYFQKIGKDILPGDSIAFAIDPYTAGLEFPDYLLVIYKKSIAPPEYRNFNRDGAMGLVSQLFLVNGNPIAIQSNGFFYHPADMISSGYWAWSEKMATMLPYDYKPR